MTDRDNLIQLVQEVRDEIDQNGNYYLLIKKFETLVPETGQYLEEFCRSSRFSTIANTRQDRICCFTRTQCSELPNRQQK